MKTPHGDNIKQNPFFNLATKLIKIEKRVPFLSRKKTKFKISNTIFRS